MSENLTLKIDGKIVEFSEGQTILQAASNAGMYIPTLCYIEGLKSGWGGCRLCIVKIDGIKGFPPACTTPAQKNMIVITKDDELQELRKEVLKLILSEHPYSCLVCDNKEACENDRLSVKKAGRMFGCFSCSNKEKCEIRNVVNYLNIKNINYELDYKNLPLKRNDPFIEMDYNMCILCGKCVRICNELRGVGAINFVNRGHDTRVSTAFDLSNLDTNCQFCGACVDICPTGALTSKNTKWFDKTSKVTTSICGFCGVGCSFDYFSYKGVLVESIPNKENIDNLRKACLFGRFCSVPFNNSEDRLKYPLINTKDGLIPCEWIDAYNTIKENLIKYKSEEIAILASSDLSNESAYLLNKFSCNILKTNSVILSIFLNNGLDTSLQLRKGNSEGVFQSIFYNNKKSQEEIINSIKEGKIKALYLTERVDNLDMLKNIEFLILQDIFPSDNFQYADVVLPATTFFEQSGSIVNSNFRLEKLTKVASNIGKSKPDWQILCELAKIFDEGYSKEFRFSNSEEILIEMKNKNPNLETDLLNDSKNNLETLNLFSSSFEKDPLQFLEEPLNLDSFKYRGEKISNHVVDLRQLIKYRSLRKSGKKVELTEEDLQIKRFRVKSNREIALNTYKMVIETPLIAKKAKPGNFIILMKDETSERIPLTISDWDVSKGTISVYFQEAGFSTKELTELTKGSHLYSVVGPLGNEVQIDKFGTVLLGGGCYGEGAIYPIARALKLVENKVIVILEARNKNQFYLEKEFEKIADEVIYCTSDGSKGLKGKIQTGLEYILRDGKSIDRCYFIGCNYMMMDASKITKERGNIPTYVSLNTIMIDGTGMCFSCRVNVFQEDREVIKLACVDGPIFDGHRVDWKKLIERSVQFIESEVKIYQTHSCNALNKYKYGENEGE